MSKFVLKIKRVFYRVKVMASQVNKRLRAEETSKFIRSSDNVRRSKGRKQK